MKPTKKVVKRKSLKKVTKVEEEKVEEEVIEMEKDDVEIEPSGTKDDESIGSEQNEDGDEEEDEEMTEDPEEKQRKTGVVYFPMIPPKYNVKRLRDYFENVAPGQVGRIFLAKNKHSKSPENRYSEGWMELKKKKVAKAIAEQVDNTQIGGKQRDYVSSMYWNIRYLSGFKWVHLMEQMQYEKEVEKRRMNVEISQARRIAAHFEEQIDKGRHLKKLEAKVKAQGGNWSAFNREVQQKKGINKKAKKERSKVVNTDSNELMSMIFK